MTSAPSRLEAGLEGSNFPPSPAHAAPAQPTVVIVSATGSRRPLRWPPTLLQSLKRRDKPVASSAVAPVRLDPGIKRPPMSRRNYIYHLFNDPMFSRASAAIQIMLAIVIFASILTLAFESVIAFNTSSSQQQFWSGLEIVYTVILTLEWLIRLVTWPGTPLSFWKDPYNIVDLIGVLPLYIHLFVTNSSAIGVVRFFRLLRVAKFLRLAKSSQKIRIIGLALYKARDAIYMYLAFSLMSVIVWAALIYYVELVSCSLNTSGSQYFYNEGPNVGRLCVFQSIVDAFWWAIVTQATVGYGDMVPVTVGGKVVAGASMLFSTLMLTLPITIVSASLAEVYQEHRQKQMELRRAKRKSQDATTLPRAAAGASPESKKLSQSLNNSRPVSGPHGGIVASQDIHNYRSDASHKHLHSPVVSSHLLPDGSPRPILTHHPSQLVSLHSIHAGAGASGPPSPLSTHPPLLQVKTHFAGPGHHEGQSEHPHHAALVDSAKHSVTSMGALAGADHPGLLAGGSAPTATLVRLCAMLLEKEVGDFQSGLGRLETLRGELRALMAQVQEAQEDEEGEGLEAKEFFDAPSHEALDGPPPPLRE